MAGRPITHAMTTTGLTLDGYRSTKSLGVVRGVTVRSRSVLRHRRRDGACVALDSASRRGAR